jgi:hypothetical protein
MLVAAISLSCAVVGRHRATGDGVAKLLGSNRAVFKMDKLVEIFGRVQPCADPLLAAIFEETGRLTPALPGDDLTTLAITWTSQRSGVAHL